LIVAEAEKVYEYMGWLIEPRALQMAESSRTPGQWKAVAQIYTDPATNLKVEIRGYISRQTFPTREEALKAAVLLGHQMIDSGIK